MPGDLRPQNLLDHIQKFSRSPQVCEWLAKDAADVDEHGRPGELFLQPGQPRVKAIPRMLVVDLAGGVEPFGQIIDHAVDPFDHGLKLFPREEVPDD